MQKEDVVGVGLYIVRAPASTSRLQLTESGLLKYLAKGSLPNDRCDSLFEPEGQIFDYLEWIAKVTSHIPERGAQLVHYYGAYSNSHRGKRQIGRLDDRIVTAFCTGCRVRNGFPYFARNVGLR